MYNNLIILMILLSLLNLTNSAQAQAPQVSLRKMDYLIGTWMREGKKGQVFEKWIKVSDHTLEGVGFQIVGKDTTYLEFLRLEQFGDDIFYTAKVAENEYPVAFRLVASDEPGFVFESPSHDFPQRIIYRQKPNETLHARIEGEENGQQSGVDFLFKKVN